MLPKGNSLMGCVAQSSFFWVRPHISLMKHNQNYLIQMVTKRASARTPCGISGDALTSSLRCTWVSAGCQCQQCASDCNLARHLQRHRRFPVHESFIARWNRFSRNSFMAHAWLAISWLDSQDLCVSTSESIVRIDIPCMFLIVFDGQDCFLHTLTCVKDMCSRIIVLDRPRHSTKRDPHPLIAGCLSP